MLEKNEIYGTNLSIVLFFYSKTDLTYTFKFYNITEYVTSFL